MGCPITLAGVPLGCKNSIGGIKRCFILNKDNLLLPPFVINGVIESLEYLPTNLKTYDFRKQTALMTSTESQTEANDTKFYTTDLALKFNKLETVKHLEILNLAKGQLVVIVQDNNDKYWYLGYDEYVSLSAGTAMTGVNYGDRNGYEITLQDLSKSLPYEVDMTSANTNHQMYGFVIPYGSGIQVGGTSSIYISNFINTNKFVVDPNHTYDPMLIINYGDLFGVLSLFNPDLTYFSIIGTTTDVKGDIIYYGSADIDINYTAITSIYAPNARSMNLSNNNLNPSGIEKQLIAMVQKGYTNGVYVIYSDSGFSNAPISTWSNAAVTAKNTLVSRGWTIIYNS